VVRVNGSLFFAAAAAFGLAVVLVLVLELDLALVPDFVVDAGVCWASAAPRNNAPMVNTPVAWRIEIRMRMILAHVHMMKVALTQVRPTSKKPAASGLFRPFTKLIDAYPLPTIVVVSLGLSRLQKSCSEPIAKPIFATRGSSNDQERLWQLGPRLRFFTQPDTFFGLMSELNTLFENYTDPDCAEQTEACPAVNCTDYQNRGKMVPGRKWR